MICVRSVSEFGRRRNDKLGLDWNPRGFNTQIFRTKDLNNG